MDNGEWLVSQFPPGDSRPRSRRDVAAVFALRAQRRRACMKRFDEIVFSADQCRKDLTELKTLLAANQDLKETQDIMPFFRTRPHLSAFLGSSEPDIIRYNLIAY